MIIYTKEDATIVIPCGLGPVVCPDVSHDLQMKQVDPSTSVLHIEPDQGFYGLYRVIVNPVTADIDPDLLASNIRRGVNILGVTGTFDGAVINNQDKTVNSSTATQQITSDAGYTGLGTVTVNAYTLDSKTVNPSVNDITVTPDHDGLSSVTVQGVTSSIDPDIRPENIKKDVEILGVTGSYEGAQILNQGKIVNSSTASQTVTFDNGYTGLSSVTVNPYTLDSKTVNSSTSSQTINSSADGLSSVTVNPYTVESKSQTITVNGQYSFAPTSADALSGVDIDVQVADIPAVVQTKSVSYNANGDYTVTPDQGYEGLSSVAINVSVGAQVNLQSKTVNSSTQNQTVTPDQGYDGLSQVDVNAISDPNLLSNNIKKGVTILGITGTFNGNPQLQQKTVNSSTNSQIVRNDGGYDGLSEVIVNPYVLDSKTVNSSTASQTVISSEDGLSSVTVNPYTVETDSSTLTQNGTYTFSPVNADALSGVTVNVSVDGQVINNQNKTVNPSTNSQSITADSGYTGLGTVTVNPYTVETDSSTLTSNGTYTFTPATADALSSVTVNVSVNSGGGSDTVYLDAFEISHKTGANAYIPTNYTPNASVNRIHGFVRGKTGSGEALRLIYTYGGYCDCYTHGINFVLEFGSGWNNKVSFTTSDANLSNGIAFDAVLSGSTWSVTVNGVTKTCTDATGSQTMWGLQLLGYDYTAMSYITFETDTDSWTFSPVAVANVSNNVINAYTGLYIKQVHTVSGIDTVTYVTQDNNGNALSSSYDFVTYEDNISTGEIIDLSGQSFGSTYTFETGNYPSGVVIPAARLQNRTVSSSTNSQTVTKTSSYYYGLDTVTINPYTVETDSSTLTQNGTYTFTPATADALSSVTVNVSVNSSAGSDWYTAWKLGNKNDLSDVNLSQVMELEKGLVDTFAYGNVYTRAITAPPVLGGTILRGRSMYQTFYNTEFSSSNGGVTISFPNLTTIGTSSVPATMAMYECFYGVTNVKKLDFPELTAVYGQEAMRHMFSCYGLGTQLEEISMPKLQTIGTQSATFSEWIDDPSGASRKLTIHVDALQSNTPQWNPAYWMGNSLTELVVNGTAANYVYLDNNPNISADSVLGVLQSLGTSGSGLSVNFASGLTVTDDAQGSIQTAYNTAINNGWTVSNLTITPYS